MPTFSDLQTRMEALRTATQTESVTNSQLGQILKDFLQLVSDISKAATPASDVSFTPGSGSLASGNNVQTAIESLSSALVSRLNAVTTHNDNDIADVESRLTAEINKKENATHATSQHSLLADRIDSLISEITVSVSGNQYKLNVVLDGGETYAISLPNDSRYSPYSGTSSGLRSTNVQAAIDEFVLSMKSQIASKLSTSELNSRVANLTSYLKAAIDGIEVYRNDGKTYLRYTTIAGDEDVFEIVPHASGVIFNNNGTGISATNVQTAIVTLITRLASADQQIASLLASVATKANASDVSDAFSDIREQLALKAVASDVQAEVIKLQNAIALKQDAATLQSVLTDLNNALTNVISATASANSATASANSATANANSAASDARTVTGAMTTLLDELDLPTVKSDAEAATEAANAAAESANTAAESANTAAESIAQYTEQIDENKDDIADLALKVDGVNDEIFEYNDATADGTLSTLLFSQENTTIREAQNDASKIYYFEVEKGQSIKVITGTPCNDKTPNLRIGFSTSTPALGVSLEDVIDRTITSQGEVYRLKAKEDGYICVYYYRSSGQWSSYPTIQISSKVTDVLEASLEEKVASLNTDINSVSQELLDSVYDEEEISLNSYDPEYHIITSSGTWNNASNWKHKAIPVVGGEKFIIYANDSLGTRFAFTKDNSATEGGTINYCEGTTFTNLQVSSNSGLVTAPSDANWLIVNTRGNASDVIYEPKEIKKYTSKFKVDDTLTEEGVGANAKTVGGKIIELSTTINNNNIYNIETLPTSYIGTANFDVENNKIAEGSSSSSRVYYAQVKEGDNIVVVGTPKKTTNLTVRFAMCETAPQKGSDITDIYSYPCTSLEETTIKYTVPKDGYVCIYIYYAITYWSVYPTINKSITIKDKIDELAEEIEDLPITSSTDVNFTLSVFNKIGVIGASWDSGYIYYEEGHEKQRNEWSWIANLGRRNGVQWKCLAQHGAYTQSWLGENPNKDADWTYGDNKTLNKKDDTPYCINRFNEVGNICDLYIIRLTGSNDTEAIGRGQYGVGSIADINDDDYTQNASSYYGYYAKIIQMIMEKNPKARIVCTYGQKDASTQSESLRAICQAAKDVAEHFGLPTINWADDDYYSTHITKSGTELIGNHPTFMQNGAMAVIFERLFSKCVDTYRTYFEKYDYTNKMFQPTKGATSARPTIDVEEGYEYYDTTLKKKIVWNGSAWVNLDGTAL